MEEEFDFISSIKSILDRKIGILIIIFICLVIGVCYTFLWVKPMYSATSKVILANNVETENGEITQGEITLNSSLLTTYGEIAKSDTVISKVISNLGLYSISVDSLRNDITVTSTEDSQIIEITVQNEDANLAQKVANELKKVFADRVYEIYGIENIKSFEDAKVPTSPSNINHTKDIIIFLAIGLIIGILYAMVANLLDNTVKNSNDIEKATGLNVIAEIPVYEFNKGRKR